LSKHFRSVHSSESEVFQPAPEGQKNQRLTYSLDDDGFYKLNENEFKINSTKLVDLENGIVRIQKEEKDFNHIDDLAALSYGVGPVEIKKKIYRCDYCKRMYQQQSRCNMHEAECDLRPDSKFKKIVQQIVSHETDAYLEPRDSPIDHMITPAITWSRDKENSPPTQTASPAQRLIDNHHVTETNHVINQAEIEEIESRNEFNSVEPLVLSPVSDGENLVQVQTPFQIIEPNAQTEPTTTQPRDQLIFEARDQHPPESPVADSSCDETEPDHVDGIEIEEINKKENCDSDVKVELFEPDSLTTVKVEKNENLQNSPELEIPENVELIRDGNKIFAKLILTDGTQKLYLLQE
jgi:hypothetical protein